jgi:hypothetical protein
MCVDIGDYAQPRLPAKAPQWSVTRAIEDDNSRIQAVQIEVIVEDEASDLTAVSAPIAKQERPALAGAAAASPEFLESVAP